MKRRFNFVDPGAIMAVVVSLILLAAGAFIFFAATSAMTPIQEKETIINKDFDVTDASVDQECDIGTSSAQIQSVQKWDGATWITISPTYWSYSGEVVTVEQEAL